METWAHVRERLGRCGGCAENGLAIAGHAAKHFADDMSFSFTRDFYIAWNSVRAGGRFDQLGQSGDRPKSVSRENRIRRGNLDRRNLRFSSPSQEHRSRLFRFVSEGYLAGLQRRSSNGPITVQRTAACVSRPLRNTLRRPSTRFRRKWTATQPCNSQAVGQFGGRLYRKEPLHSPEWREESAVHRRRRRSASSQGQFQGQSGANTGSRNSNAVVYLEISPR